mmetsp:Transcript_23585/g.41423  ORF Transcript_23585/g.41423 Transcript_23585/m.41423 type:complete len:280 (+) Transcript_23585:350-1189(+)
MARRALGVARVRTCRTGSIVGVPGRRKAPSARDLPPPPRPPPPLPGPAADAPRRTRAAPNSTPATMSPSPRPATKWSTSAPRNQPINFAACQATHPALTSIGSKRGLRWEAVRAPSPRLILRVLKRWRMREDVPIFTAVAMIMRRATRCPRKVLFTNANPGPRALTAPRRDTSQARASMAALKSLSTGRTPGWSWATAPAQSLPPPRLSMFPFLTWVDAPTPGVPRVPPMRSRRATVSRATDWFINANPGLTAVTADRQDTNRMWIRPPPTRGRMPGRQ